MSCFKRLCVCFFVFMNTQRVCLHFFQETNIPTREVPVQNCNQTFLVFIIPGSQGTFYQGVMAKWKVWKQKWWLQPKSDDCVVRKVAEVWWNMCKVESYTSMILKCNVKDKKCDEIYAVRLCWSGRAKNMINKGVMLRVRKMCRITYLEQ